MGNGREILLSPETLWYELMLIFCMILTFEPPDNKIVL
jgi:hypothetical protein